MCTTSPRSSAPSTSTSRRRRLLHRRGHPEAVSGAPRFIGLRGETFPATQRGECAVKDISALLVGVAIATPGRGAPRRRVDGLAQRSCRPPRDALARSPTRIERTAKIPANRTLLRRGRDSNPRYACAHNGFRDRPVRVNDKITTFRGRSRMWGLRLAIGSSVVHQHEQPDGASVGTAGQHDGRAARLDAQPGFACPGQANARAQRGRREVQVSASADGDVLDEAAAVQREVAGRV
jgi:hypothetical protein